MTGARLTDVRFTGLQLIGSQLIGSQLTVRRGALPTRWDGLGLHTNFISPGLLIWHNQGLDQVERFGRYRECDRQLTPSACPLTSALQF